MNRESSYFSRRAHEERVAAMKAAHPRARSAHLELAMRYAALAEAIDERRRHLAVEISGAA